MQITKLRLIGFKSFVEPTDLAIEHGLTGVVGPNGCGKSNLLEALRWVMGETSYKSMRASAMDDVIFSGTTSRPARNSAEVVVFIDNAERTAPAAFNDDEEIVITRRIEREAGSAYRINGREARARDVKILFEDAATGARSPALVRQGQIGEIVNAKPEQRRRVLEDAAGIAGLHSRRHEAELRLKAADNNLARIGDTLGQLKSQVDSLKRQARQARRYADLSAELRKAEAIVLYLTWQHANDEVMAEEAALQNALQQLAMATALEAEMVRLEAELAERIQPLRDEEAKHAAIVTRLRHEQQGLAGEASRLEARQRELEGQRQRLEEDRTRETDLIAEAGRQLERLEAELAVLDREGAGAPDREAELEARRGAALECLAKTETAHGEITQQLSDRNSEERGLRAVIGDRTANRDRVVREIAGLDGELEKLGSQSVAAGDHVRLRQALVGHDMEIQRLEAALGRYAGKLENATAQLQTLNGAREAAQIELRSLETEHDTLAELVHAPVGAFKAVLDEITVARGYEIALAAALGDDIEAALDDEAPIYWASPDADVDGDAADDGDREIMADPRLPKGCKPLIGHVEAPAALHRRLSQVGIVAKGKGRRLQAKLAPGQRLVSRDGDLWRWDGFIARADAPSPAAKRLAGRNRLAELKSRLAGVRNAAARAASAVEQTEARIARLRKAEARLRSDLATARPRREQAQTALQSFERRLSETKSRQETVLSSRAAAGRRLDELTEQITQNEQALANLPEFGALEVRQREATEQLRAERDAAAELTATLASHQRERQRAEQRRAQISEDISGWGKRREQSAERVEQIISRLGEVGRELGELADQPASLEERRGKVADAVAQAERERSAAADAIAEAETALREATTTLRQRTNDVAGARENRARGEARLEGARLKRAGIVQSISDTLEVAPEGCLTLAEVEADDLPSLDQGEQRLARIRADRERLGGVNLQAEQELGDLEAQYETLDRERGDVEAAVAKLRSGIASLNREGRKRLAEAFETVNGHFQMLFATLFDGGEARLEMIESDDDPLAGGLEIIAKPPGKKPTTLSLLSGGEQTLTALSLIFAVFLTNPSPICVLDEVDAPLDDSNVDRFCRMMEKMSADTATRFLCITHHPETMARMDRLYGVTMAERGVSQLVSVDLEAAERFLEAGE